MDPKQIVNFSLPIDFYAGRIWGRSNCTTINGTFTCETGDCGFEQCAFDGVQRGGEPPASLAEFTLRGNDDQDFFDISLVDGYNLQITIHVTNPNTNKSGDYWCKDPTCNRDLNQICPEELKKRNSQGIVIACLSACEKFDTDEYCCRGAFGSPTTCKSINWPVNYPAIFKKVFFK